MNAWPRPPRDDLSKRLYYEGPTAFSRAELAAEPNPFAHRAALFFTPTKNIPDDWVGERPLTVRLPLGVTHPLCANVT